MGIVHLACGSIGGIDVYKRQEESWEEFPASDDSSENTDGSTDESADGDISEVGGTDTGDGSDSSAEITDISLSLIHI